MQENEQPFEAWTGYYKIEYLDTEPKVTVFAKLEKIQKQAILEKIKRVEAQLISLEEELDIFLAQR